jgi:hypothetical protein
VWGICSLDLGHWEAIVDAGSRRELTITFDVEGNWRTPFSLDQTDEELTVLGAVIGAITHRVIEPREAHRASELVFTEQD